MRWAEIFLTKKFVAAGEWQDLIAAVNKFESFLSHWQIVIVCENNRLRYFLRTNSRLPITLAGLEAFLINEISPLDLPTKYLVVPFVNKDGNIVETMDYFRLKKSYGVKWIELDFAKIIGQNFVARASFYVETARRVLKYKTLTVSPARFLAVDFEATRNYLYQTAPKYLEMSKVLPICTRRETGAVL